MNWLIASVHAAQDGIATTGIRAIEWAAWIWVIFLSGIGGIVSFIGKLRLGQARPFNFAELLGEVLVSVFVGVVTFLLCIGSGLNEVIAGGLSGLTGHMGTRALMRAEKWLDARFKH